MNYRAKLTFQFYFRLKIAIFQNKLILQELDNKYLIF
jgi:hypothetical protein